MDIFLGLAYYSKGSTLALIPAFPIFYIVARGNFRSILRDKKFLIGMLMVFMAIAPWWIRNTIHFGNPFHSTQKYWSGFIGYGSGGAYPVYWDKPKPSFFATKLPLGISVVAKKAKEYTDTNLQWALVDLPAKPGSDPPINFKYFITFEAVRACFRDFPAYPIGLPIGFLGIPAFWGLFFLWRNRRIYIVPLVCGGLFLFLSIFWGPIDRLALPAIPLVIALGWTGYSALLEKICQCFSRTRIAGYIRLASIVLIICGTLITIVYNTRANLNLYREGVREGLYPYVDSPRKKNRIIAAHWLRDNTPLEAIAMDVEPWDLHFYSDRRTVHTPSDSMERILWVMRTYGVNYITYNDQDSLKPLFSGEMPGFELVNEQGLRIYRVDYSKIPVSDAYRG